MHPNQPSDLNLQGDDSDSALLDGQQAISDLPDPDVDAATAAALAAISIDIQKRDKRQRQITARITLPYTREQVWQVLTDYEGLSDFIPNLASSQLLEHPEGGIRLEQVGVQNALFLKFSARVVLDMTEDFLNAIHFEMAAGDFKAFAGDWLLAQPSEGEGTELTYRLFIWPKRTMPIIAIERRLRYDLPRNLLAIQRQLEMMAA
jgi:ribosome-associated toxin RatA of RatAB toxin-antitoxin module